MLLPVMDSLKRSYKGPSLEPHITLLGSLSPTKERILGCASEVFQKISPFHVTLGNVSYSPTFFQSLFLQVEKTQELVSLYEKVKATFDPFRTKVYQPHLSLMYGMQTEDVKAEIIASLPSWHGISFVVDSIAVVSTEGATEEWRQEEIFFLQK